MGVSRGKHLLKNPGIYNFMDVPLVLLISKSCLQILRVTWANHARLKVNTQARPQLPRTGAAFFFFLTPLFGLIFPYSPPLNNP